MDAANYEWRRHFASHGGEMKNPMALAGEVWEAAHKDGKLLLGPPTLMTGTSKVSTWNMVEPMEPGVGPGLWPTTTFNSLPRN